MHRRAVLFVVFCLACGRTPSRPQALIPWAWERREDLRFSGAREVAYLAATIEVGGDRVLTKPRMQPLRVSDGAQVIPVIRIEARRAPGASTATQVADEIARVASRVHPRLLQLDFDATQSQRAYYASLLHALRARLEPSTKISITALASWCLDDLWLQSLPIDEAVPMLFRMGPETKVIRERLARGADFREPRCRTSLGIATDEPLQRAPAGGRRVYVFHTQSWDAAAWQTAQKEIARWE